MRHMLPVLLAALSSLGAGLALGGNVLSKLDVELYGYVKLDAVYDSQVNAVGDIELFVLPEGRDKDSEFTLTARQTRFGMKVKAPDVANAKATACIEAGFWGEENDPVHKTKLRLRLAYADMAWDNWAVRAGQDWDPFITVIPRSLNFTYFGWQGSPGYRRAVVRVSNTCKPLGDACKLTTHVAATRSMGDLYVSNNARPGQGDLDGDGQNDGDDSAIPAFQGNAILEAKWWTPSRAKFSVSGLWGQEVLDTAYEGGTNAVAKNDIAFDSWMVMASTYIPLVEVKAGESAHKVGLQGAYWEGSNLDAYEAGIGLGITYMLRMPGGGYETREVDACGGWAQIMYDYGKWNINFGYGVDDPDDKDLNTFAVDKGNARCRNEFFMGSVYYKLNSAVTVALELSQLKTDYKDGADAVNDRAHAAAFYYF